MDLAAEVASSRHAQAKFELAMLFQDDRVMQPARYDYAQVLIGEAANAGHSDAQYWYGLYHVFGIGGVAKDVNAGLDWLRKASDQHHVMATVMAWDMLTQGSQVPNDTELAYRLGRNVAQKGYAYGATMAASSLLQSKKPFQHTDEILHWLDEAVAKGDRALIDQITPIKAKFVALVNQREAGAAARRQSFKAQPLKVCPVQQSFCLVDHLTGAKSCNTYPSWWC